MGIDTYLVVPVAAAVRAKRLLEAQGDSIAHVGRDYVVLYEADSYDEVERSPEKWGPIYAQALPSSIRKGLDARGLLACPEVGQSFNAETYADEVRSHGSPLWLPVRRVRRQLTKRLILVSLSPAREQMLFQEPELVQELVANRATTTIPHSIEFGDCWIELQRALFDYLGAGTDDARAEALTPRAGLSFLENKTIDSARLVRVEQARATAQWVGGLPPNVIALARQQGPSVASRNFPQSLGSAEADDLEPARPQSSLARGKHRHSDQELELELTRLRAFYADLLRAGHAVLSIRFRE